MSSNVERNAEIDARHAKEPETEFSFTLNKDDAAAFYCLVGQTDVFSPLGDLALKIEAWLESNHPDGISQFEIDMAEAIKIVEITP